LWIKKKAYSKAPTRRNGDCWRTTASKYEKEEREEWALGRAEEEKEGMRMEKEWFRGSK